MRNVRWHDTVQVAALSVLALAVWMFASERRVWPVQPQSVDAPPSAASQVGAPLFFEPNVGQAPAGVEYVARGSSYVLQVLGDGSLAVAAGGESVRLHWEGARTAPASARLPLATRVNYLRGRDPRNWRTGVRTYGELRYSDVYDGIDLVYYGRGGNLEYDFIVRPGADPSAIELRVDGAKSLALSPGGDLLIETAGGTLRQRRPHVYQPTSGGMRTVDGRFVLHGPREVGFQLASYDADAPVIIDPVLDYSTYVGGMSDDDVQRIALGADGAVYATGTTRSSNFATAPGGAPILVSGFSDMYVAKLAPGGSAWEYVTIIGGTGEDRALGLAAGVDGSAYVTGQTDSFDFPVTAGGDRFLGGTRDAFVLKLAPNGAVAYASLIGGGQEETGTAIAVGTDGSAYVTGTTGSLDFPLNRPLQAAYGGRGDAFVARFSPEGALDHATYLGGEGRDTGWGIAVDSGFIYLVGETSSTRFPGAPETPRADAQDSDGFVAKLDAAGGGLTYARLLGGSGPDRARDVAVAGGAVYVAGGASSGAVAAPLPPGDFRGGMDAFVVRLDAAGLPDALTMLGGVGDDIAQAVASDGAGTVYVGGFTSSVDLPVMRALQIRRRGDSDAFLAALGAAELDVQMLTYLGGGLDERSLSVAAQGPGFVYLGGGTASEDFPLSSGVDEDSGGNSEGFIGRINLAGNSANLVASVSSSPDPGVAGEVATLTAIVRNEGPDSATQASLVLTVFNRVEFVSMQSSRGTCVRQDAANTERTVIACELGTLAFGADARVQLGVRPSDTEALTAVAQVVAAEPDIDSVDSRASVTVEVQATAPTGNAGSGGGLGGMGWLSLGLMGAAAWRRRGR